MVDFKGKYTIDQVTKCWVWNKEFSPSRNYPAIWIGNGTMDAHRLMFIQIYGTIPIGKDVHHECKNKKCINPSHLKLHTHSYHMSLHKKTHCKRGHELTSKNIYIKYGYKKCKICISTKSKKKL